MSTKKETVIPENERTVLIDFNEMLFTTLSDIRDRFLSLRQHSHDNRNDRARAEDRRVMRNVKKALDPFGLTEPKTKER